MKRAQKGLQDGKQLGVPSSLSQQGQQHAQHGVLANLRLKLLQHSCVTLIAFTARLERCVVAETETVGRISGSLPPKSPLLVSFLESSPGSVRFWAIPKRQFRRKRVKYRSEFRKPSNPAAKYEIVQQSFNSRHVNEPRQVWDGGAALRPVCFTWSRAGKRVRPHVTTGQSPLRRSACCYQWQPAISLNLSQNFMTPYCV